MVLGVCCAVPVSIFHDPICETTDLSAFRTYLAQLYRLATWSPAEMVAPLERYVQNICDEVPAPPPGSFEVTLELLGRPIRFWAPPADQPIAYVGLPYRALFECLDVRNVLLVWRALAGERKVLLVSARTSLLAVVAEVLCSALFPMRWAHLYVPCLPRALTPMLDAPVPYLCGIDRGLLPRAAADLSDEAVVVDLDRNAVALGPRTPALPCLPPRRRLKLEASLEKHAVSAARRLGGRRDATRPSACRGLRCARRTRFQSRDTMACNWSLHPKRRHKDMQ